MEKILQGFKRSVIHGAVQINDLLINNNRTWVEVQQYLDEHGPQSLMDINVPAKRPPVDMPLPVKTCPSCKKHAMRLLPVTGNDRYKSRWLCGSGCGSCNRGGGCGYVEFNELSMEEIIKNGGV